MNFEFCPQGVNLLIGPNNSGKTSLCQAMHFLGLTTSLTVKDAMSICTPEFWKKGVFTSLQ